MSVLVAVDEKGTSTRLIRTASDLATARGEELHVLHVIPRREAQEHFRALREIDEFRDIALSAEDERAREIARRLYLDALPEEAHADVTAVGRVGDPAEVILSVADRVDASYVVVGGRKRSPAGKALFGSVTQDVLLNADVPTVTVMEEG